MTRSNSTSIRTARRVLVGMLATVLVATGLSALGASGAGAGTAGGISAGFRYSCAVLGDTSARCWGVNDDRQLGGTVGSTPVPVPLPVTSSTGATITGITQIAAGYGIGVAATCARFTNGTARCWGANDAGQLGDGSRVGRPHPVFVRNPDGSPMTGVAAVSVGFEHACARMVSGQVRCWGANGAGQLGDGTTTDRSRPVTVTTASGAALTGVTSVVTGEFLTCARLANGKALCWGKNAYGQVGDGTTTDQTRAVTILNTDSTPLTGIAEVAAGESHACARLTNGTVRCWGANTNGQLGDGTNVNRTTPVFVRPTPSTVLTGATSVTAALDTTCARLTSGQVRCWGNNSNGQLGNGSRTNRTRPATVITAVGRALTGVTSVVTGGVHGCARLTSGQMRCWGVNVRGEVGDGTTLPRYLPVPVIGGSLTGVT